MSAFNLFVLVLLAAVTVFALANPSPITIRFLAWEAQTTVAAAVMGAAIAGGLLVLVSCFAGQMRSRARIRELQAMVHALEARPAGPAGPLPDENA